jgi:hypothetical protein
VPLILKQDGILYLPALQKQMLPNAVQTTDGKKLLTTNHPANKQLVSLLQTNTQRGVQQQQGRSHLGSSDAGIAVTVPAQYFENSCS